MPFECAVGHVGFSSIVCRNRSFFFFVIFSPSFLKNYNLTLLIVGFSTLILIFLFIIFVLSHFIKKYLFLVLSFFFQFAIFFLSNSIFILLISNVFSLALL